MLAGCATKKTRYPREVPRLVTTGALAGVFQTTDEAALVACEHLKSIPLSRTFEFAGTLYRDDAGIRIGTPETIGDPEWSYTPEPPVGTILVGDYHGHTTDEMFSDTDKNTRRKTPIYLCTPSGGVLRYTPEDGKIVRLR